MAPTALFRTEESSLDLVAADDERIPRRNRRIIVPRYGGPDVLRVMAFQVAKLRDQHPQWFREDAAALFALLGECKIKPLVAERIPLAEARRAHDNLGHGGITGKQVLICDARPW